MLEIDFQKNLSTSDRLLFVCASPGNGGHRLARIISCCENVHWYSDVRNGIHPWDVYYNPEHSKGKFKVSGKDISPYHFDRYIGELSVPLVGERIERYWNNEDLEYFYQKVWVREMKRSGALDIIDSRKFLLWVVHDDPQYILRRFPNSMIINLIDDSIEKTVSRYLKTTAMFPIELKDKRLKPAYQTNYSYLVETLLNSNPKANTRDLWTYEIYQQYQYESKMEDRYRLYVKKYLDELHEKKQFSHKNVCNLKWSSFSIEQLPKELGSADERMEQLINET